MSIEMATGKHSTIHDLFPLMTVGGGQGVKHPASIPQPVPPLTAAFVVCPSLSRHRLSVKAPFRINDACSVIWNKLPYVMRFFLTFFPFLLPFVHWMGNNNNNNEL